MYSPKDYIEGYVIKLLGQHVEEYERSNFSVLICCIHDFVPSFMFFFLLQIGLWHGDLEFKNLVRMCVFEECCNLTLLFAASEVSDVQYRKRRSPKHSLRIC
jgi:hypothetical protein